MSEGIDDDKESKTFDPTEKKLQDAMEKGNLPVVKEIFIGVSVLGLLGLLLFGHMFGIPLIVLELAALLEFSRSVRLESAGDIDVLLRGILKILLVACGPVSVLLLILTVALGAAQVSPSPRAERVAPKLSNLSLIKGFKRLFSLQSLLEFFKSVIKVCLLTIVLIIAIWKEWPRITSSYFVETSVAPSAIVEIFVSLLGPMMICIIALSIADLFLSRFRWLRNLKMSRHEIKEEYRQTEGDPLVRSRMKSIALSRARRRILTEVPKATMIVANPTHYAIALRYVSGETNVPVVLAKGTDYLAIKIRETADENFIPIVENKRLARAMYNEVDIGKIIPPEFFRGIAEIIIMLKAMREGRPYRPPSGSRIVHGRPAAA